MGHVGNPGHADVQAAVFDFARRCKAAGKAAGTLGATPEFARKYIDAGFDFVALSSDLGFLTGQARATLSALREQARPATGASY
jgi:2-keto-3-deoxy-L-rhamnonate aldolase RhmA